MTQQKRKKLRMDESLLKKVRFSSTKPEDMTAYYKAYQMGNLKTLHSDFDPDIFIFTRAEFETVFRDFVNLNHFLTITFWGFSEDDLEVPIGLLTLWPRERILHINHMVWFPWSTVRQRIENTINVFDTLRRTIHAGTGKNFKLVGFSKMEDERFYKKLFDLNIMTRIGKAEGFIEDASVLWYTSVEVKKDK